MFRGTIGGAWIALLLSAIPALSQNVCPSFTDNNTVTAAQLNSCFAAVLRGQAPNLVTAGDPAIFTTSPNVQVIDNGPLGYGVPSVTPQIVYVGDSLTSGLFGTHPYPFYITLPTYNGVTLNATNIGAPGLDLTTMFSNEVSNLDPLYAYRGGLNIAVIWGGTNDIAQDNKTASQTFATLQAFTQHVRSKGFKVIVATAISRGGSNGGGQFDAQNQALNLLIRNNWSQFADALTDLAGNTNLGATSAYLNATYFNADGIHLTDTGYSLVGSIVQNTINILVGNPGTLYQTGNDTYNHIMVSGLSAGLRVLTNNVPAALIDATDPTGAVNYQALGIGGSQLVFNIAGVEKGRIDNAGNVGFGTTTMQGRFNVTSPDATAQAFFAGTTKGLSISTSAAGSAIAATDNANSTYQPLGIGGSLTIFNVSNVEKGRWNGTGLGIGATPATLLDVNGTFRVTQASPASGAACVAGQIVGDTGFLYTCSASGAWKRVAVTGGY